MSSTSTRREIWRERIADWWANAWRWVLMAVGAVTAVYLLLDRGVQNGAMTAIALAALVIGAALSGSKPLAIALIATPGLLIVQRVGLGGGDLSVSDVALAAAFGTAVLLAQRPFSRPLRMLLWLNLFYQFTTLFTVIVNPYLANTVEWFHAWLLISGALIVGWALGAAGYARLALSLIVVSACVIAVLTLVQGVSTFRRRPGPGVSGVAVPMHKNFVGTTLAFAAVVVYINPDWVGWTKGWAWSAFWLLTVAVVISQSRQALIGLIAAVLIAVIRRKVTGRSRFVFLLIIPAVWLIVGWWSSRSSRRSGTTRCSSGSTGSARSTTTGARRRCSATGCATGTTMGRSRTNRPKPRWRCWRPPGSSASSDSSSCGSG